MPKVCLGIGSSLASPEEAERHGLRVLEEIHTAPRYRIYALEDRWAALVEDAEGGISVPGRLFEVPDGEWDALIAGEPEGFEQRPVELEDGRTVTAAFADEALLEERAVDITAYGGFLEYLAARNEGG